MSDNGVQLGGRFGYCQVCSRRFFVSRLRKRWDDLWVCPADWEIRNPQEYVRGVPDLLPQYPVLPSPGVEYSTYCTVQGRSAIPGFSVPGCMIPGFAPAFDPPTQVYG